MFYTPEKFNSEQPVLSRYILNLIKSQKFPSGLLIYGENNAPLYETGMYILQSLNCEKKSLACSSCPSCVRFLQGIHPDCYIIDGEKKTIRKQDIDDLISHFELSSFETNHISAYLIHRVENITEEAINALLKFLEEPRENLFAILTSANRERVLPTILSRVEQMRVLSLDLAEVMKGVPSDISSDAYYVLSNLYYSEEKKKEVSLTKEFDLALNGACQVIEAVSKNQEVALTLFNKVADPIKQAQKKSGFETSKCYNYFYSSLAIAFSDLLNNKADSPFVKLLDSKDKKLTLKLAHALEFIQDCQAKMSANLSFVLTLAQLGKILEGH